MKNHLEGHSKRLSLHIKSLVRLWRGKNDASPLTDLELSSVSKALLELQRGLTGGRELAGRGYMQDKNLLGAYLLYYWPVSYMQISFCIDYFSASFANLALKEELSVLDVGSGPGPASFATADYALKINPLLNVDVDLLDSSDRALALAKKIFSVNGKSFRAKTYRVNLEQGDFSFLEKKYDIIIVSHALNELWKESECCAEKKEGMLLLLKSYLKKGGILLLCEPALLLTSRSLIQLRDFLVKNGMQVLAPCCPSSDGCPAFKAGEKQTCHAELSWNPLEPVADLARLSHLDRTSVKMTFFAFCETATGDEAFEGKSYRVVSDPMLNKSGRVRLLLCNGKERIAFSAKKDDPHAESEGFFALRRYDRIVLENPQLRGTGENKAYGVADGTKILKNQAGKSKTLLPFPYSCT